MITKFKILLAFSFLISTVTGVKAETNLPKPRIGIISMINTTKDTRYDIICSTVTETISITLKLIGKYRVESISGINPYKETLRDAQRYAKEKKLDNMIFGKAYLNRDKNIVFEMSLYDKKKNKITITERAVAKSIFDIFNASDQLASNLVGRFSGYHIGFGVIQLKNNGEQGDFSVYIDNNFIAKNSFNIKKVLNGNRLVEIRQKRMLGEVTIFRKELDVKEDSTYNIGFSIPYLTEKEKQYLDGIKKKIRKEWNNGKDSETINRLFTKVLNLLDDISYSKAIKKEKDNFEELFAEYRIKENRRDIKDSFFTPDVALLNNAVTLYLNADSYLKPEYIKSGVEKNTALLANIFGIKASFYLSKQELKKAIASYGKIFEISTFISPVDYYQFNEEKNYIGNVISSRNKIDTNVVFPSFILTAALGLGGISGYFWYDNTGKKLADEGSNLYAQYEVSTDSDKLKNLHNEIKNKYTFANLAEITKWGGPVLSAIMAGVSVYAIINKLTAKKRVTGDRLAGYLGEKIKLSKAAYKGHKKINGKELIVITNPTGMMVYLNGKKYGNSPIRLKGLKENQVKITARDDWFKEVSEKVRLNKDRNIVFLKSGKSKKYPSDMETKSYTIENNGYFLSWKKVEGADHYIVQAGRIGEKKVLGDILYENYDVKGTEIVFKKKWNSKGYQVFRICAVNKNGIRSKWKEGSISTYISSKNYSKLKKSSYRALLFYIGIGGGISYDYGNFTVPVPVNSGLNISFGGNIYWGADVYYIFNAPPGYPVPVPSIILFNGFKKISHIFSALYLPLGSNSGAAMFGYGIAKNHFILSSLFEATFAFSSVNDPIAQAQALISVGYMF